ncbi:G-D-S-L family lipolytic protein [Mesonia sp. K7]|uniref:G-D-S-L family lipolytic protein n=1 Tax=Mesonia sp. K7 TaxID=2218606 RepID=UPI000DA79DCE|nr:G-D-S-L family lipolytic protein [Mesonia sp. K7]PZD78804.1 G-D-S-L family lipolytic protein [Mesonia sp. K7]
MKLRHISYIAIAAIGFASCEPEFDNPVEDGGYFDQGSADFTTYVALGNSLTAGYADGALYIRGQENSFPNILAQQFMQVGGGEFTQPLMNDNLGGLLLGGNQIAAPRLKLTLVEGSPSPVPVDGTPTTEVTNTLSGGFNNMGVPGAKSFHLLAPGYGNVAGVQTGQANPYFVRFRSAENTTVLEDAVAQNPTFFSLWIGNNDVLSYATSGGIGVDQTGNFDPSTYGPNDITDPNVFGGAYTQIVDGMISAGASSGVVLNIPDVASTAFFNTVPTQPISPADLEGQLATLNGTYAQLNQAFAFLGVPERSIQFSESGPSGLVVKDESLPDMSAQLTAVLTGAGVPPAQAQIFGQQYGQARQTIYEPELVTPSDTSDDADRTDYEDLILLTTSSVIGVVNEDRVATLVGMGVPQAEAAQLSINGITYPLEDQYVLIKAEQDEVAAATTAYNQTIKAITDANNLAFVDANALLDQLANGGLSLEDGTFLTSEFATGGAFSLDGIHLTPRGYAFIANEIIKAIELKYEAEIPNVNVGQYSEGPALY